MFLNCRLGDLSPDRTEEAATLWRAAWLDGHAGKVPAALMAARQLDHFTRYLGEHRADATVAVGDDGRLLGLVIADPRTGEVVQLAVSARSRGAGVADLLLDCAEVRLAREHRFGWLAVVPDNARARTFYARRGWRDAGAMTYPAPADASTVPVPVRRYVKDLHAAQKFTTEDDR